MQKYVTNLWFDKNADEAVNFYISLFGNGKIIRTLRYGEAAAKQAGMNVGDVMTIDFQLNGQDFTVINGGPAFKLNEAMSIAVNCKDQAEIDRLWDALSKDGGKPGPCGWITDKFGLSWQIVPESLTNMYDKLSPEKFEQVMEAMLKMNKLDAAALEAASK